MILNVCGPGAFFISVSGSPLDVDGFVLICFRIRNLPV